MTVSRLTTRLDKLGGAKASREVFLEIKPGESPEDLAHRVEAVREWNRPVMAMPVQCATIEEWAELCAHYGHSVVWERGKK
jgi:hypothetical protein